MSGSFRAITIHQPLPAAKLTVRFSPIDRTSTTFKFNREAFVNSILSKPSQIFNQRPVLSLGRALIKKPSERYAYGQFITAVHIFNLLWCTVTLGIHEIWSNNSIRALLCTAHTHQWGCKPTLFVLCITAFVTCGQAMKSVNTRWLFVLPNIGRCWHPARLFNTLTRWLTFIGPTLVSVDKLTFK